MQQLLFCWTPHRLPSCPWLLRTCDIWDYNCFVTSMYLEGQCLLFYYYSFKLTGRWIVVVLTLSLNKLLEKANDVRREEWPEVVWFASDAAWCQIMWHLRQRTELKKWKMTWTECLTWSALVWIVDAVEAEWLHSRRAQSLRADTAGLSAAEPLTFCWTESQGYSQL